MSFWLRRFGIGGWMGSILWSTTGIDWFWFYKTINSTVHIR